ncbi:hypothetical protein CPLU01_10812 [Colletotrichum plurivorum]|uniref:Uncharacterized protein n=1 Tax=Colletotrichum plurivorum TaxID=2175906 RepID=A0A8H6K4D1_9PEZI|nr:hypothetical protein CPLU01_10812 [Colletotrichum plurivorum]
MVVVSSRVGSEQHGEDQKRRPRIDFGVWELGSSNSSGGGRTRTGTGTGTGDSNKVRDLSELEAWGETAMAHEMSWTVDGGGRYDEGAWKNTGQEPRGRRDRTEVGARDEGTSTATTNMTA